MTSLRRWLAGALVAVGLLGVAPVASAPAVPRVFASKSCSGSFTHAVVNGAEKCLRTGQFCARGADRQYRRYGFRCTKRDARGNYHLT